MSLNSGMVEHGFYTMGLSEIQNLLSLESRSSSSCPAQVGSELSVCLIVLFTFDDPRWRVF